MIKQVVYTPPSAYNSKNAPIYDSTIVNPKRKGWSININGTDGTTVSSTINDDVILTGILVTGGADAGCSTYGMLYLNNILIFSINNGLADANDVNITYIPFPDWLIKKGDVIKMTLSAVGGAVAGIGFNLIGYYAQ